MKRVIRIFTIHSEDPEKIREELMMGFPAFLINTNLNKEVFQIKYSELGNARFDLKYGYDIKDFVSMAFFDKKENVTYKPRKLNIS
jgi:hypothetical protein